MNPDSLDLDLPVGEPLPPPPPADPQAFQAWQDENLAEFYRSPHYEVWLKRTWESKTKGQPFVWID